MTRKHFHVLWAVDTTEEHRDIQMKTAQVLKARGDLDEAEEMYRKSLEINEKLGASDNVTGCLELLEAMRRPS